jgi:HAD superfamily hydrolase (TIGR01509 family)
MIKGVLFDMDGVVLDTERIGREIFIHHCHRVGYPQMDNILFERLLGVTRDENRRLLKEALGEEFPFDEMYDAYRADLYEMAIRGELPCKEGVKECFEGLKARGIKVALATSTARPIVENYQKHIPTMRNIFDFMVCGAEAGRSKPAPDVFLKAAAGLGLDIHECIGVEDSVAGLKSQTAAGCTRVLMPDLLPCDQRFEGLWDYCLPTLHDLCPLIDRLNGAEHA